MKSPSARQTVHNSGGFTTPDGVSVLCGSEPCTRRAVWRHRRTGKPPRYRCALCRHADQLARTEETAQ